MNKQSKKTAPLLPAYLVVGEDALKREAVIKRMRIRMSELGDLAFNSDEFQGETALGEDIVAACDSLPFASEKRLVAVQNVEKLKKADSDVLVSYLEHPNDSTVLLLIAEKLAKNTRLFKAVSAIGKAAVIDCSPPTVRELPAKVRDMAVSHGVVFTEGAARCLIDRVGTNMVHLDAEITKIALAHKGNDPVTDHEVISLVTRTAEIKPWEFVDAFCERDLKKCVALLDRMPSASPIMLLSMLVTRVRELIAAQTLQGRGQSDQLAAYLKFPDWRVKNHRRWARMYDPAELQRALILSRDAEQAMKSGTEPAAALIDWLVKVLPKS